MACGQKRKPCERLNVHIYRSLLIALLFTKPGINSRSKLQHGTQDIKILSNTMCVIVYSFPRKLMILYQYRYVMMFQSKYII
jgi:hypothetical protein